MIVACDIQIDILDQISPVCCVQYQVQVGGAGNGDTDTPTTSGLYLQYEIFQTCCLPVLLYSHNWF